MKIDFSKLKKLSGSIFESFIVTQAPAIAEGFLQEYLRDVKPDELIDMIKANKSLWDLVSEEDKQTLKQNIHRLGELEWLTPEWAINALRSARPEFASLFLSWPEAYKWFELQVATIKEGSGHAELNT